MDFSKLAGLGVTEVRLGHFFDDRFDDLVEAMPGGRRFLSGADEDIEVYEVEIDGVWVRFAHDAPTPAGMVLQ